MKFQINRETEKTEDKKDEPEDAEKDDSKEKTPLVEADKVRVSWFLCSPVWKLKLEGRQLFV